MVMNLFLSHVAQLHLNIRFLLNGMAQYIPNLMSIQLLFEKNTLLLNFNRLQENDALHGSSFFVSRGFEIFDKKLSMISPGYHRFVCTFLDIQDGAYMLHSLHYFYDSTTFSRIFHVPFGKPLKFTMTPIQSRIRYPEMRPKNTVR